MTLSRPFLLALIGVGLLAVTFQASRTARDRAGGEPAASTAPQTSAVAPSPGKSATSRRPTKKAAPQRRPEPRNSQRPERRPGQRRSRRRDAGREAGLPAPVARALARGDVILLLLYQPGSADDDATAAAVDSLKAGRGVAVFSDRIKRLADYRRVIGELGVSQAPAIVIVGRDRKARLIEGFVDSETLRQAVADAR